MIKLNLLFPLGALAVLAFGNAVAQPAPVATEKTHTISATVEKIDAKQRLVELRKGEETQTIQVPPEVRNFDKIKVGDEVVVTYYEGLAAEFKKKGESKTIGVLDATTGTARMYAEGGSWAALAAHRGYWDDQKFRTTLGFATGDLLYDIDEVDSSYALWLTGAWRF